MLPSCAHCCLSPALCGLRVGPQGPANPALLSLSKLLETSFSPGLGLKYSLPSFCVYFLPLGQVVNLLRMGACVWLLTCCRFPFPGEPGRVLGAR